MEYIKQLERAGDQVELRRLATTLPQGDALARVFIALSKLEEDVATTGAEYRQALGFAHQAVAAADQGGLMWTWAQGRVSALSADLGMYPAAERAACAFLEALPGNPKSEAMLPYVHFALARVHASRRQYAAALEYWHLTEESATGELAERARLHHAWTLAEAGRPTDALTILPGSVSQVSPGHLAAVAAVIYAAVDDWQSARLHALAALRSRANGEWRICDTVQAAELMLILKRAAIRAGDFGQGAVWHEHSAAALSGWNADLTTCLLPTLPQGGGAFFEEQASSCGPAGDRRTGLRGVVG